ncbi:MAG TPA: membrane dipeptidase, partial [Chthoniobacterales bacterium]
MISSIEQRITRLHAHGLVDLHFDLPMELYEKRANPGLLAAEFLSQWQAGEMGVVAAAIFIEDRYVPDKALPVALEQIARLHAETENCEEVRLCRSYAEIKAARAAGKIAVLMTMEGVEPIGTDLDLLRNFYQLGIRIVGLTQFRSNAAGHGGVFDASGSSPEGLTEFGRQVVRECERLGIILDLAHINPAGFEEIVALTKRPLIVSHSNARHYHDIERNMNDEQIRMIGARGGVIGVNAVLVSARPEDATLDHYVDHIEHIAGLIGMDGVGIGFDFFEFIYRQWPEEKRRSLAAKSRAPHFIPDLSDHSHARNLTRKLIERGLSDKDI